MPSPASGDATPAGPALGARGGEPDVRRLRVLRAVADHGSFAAAAAELRYTPSAISQQVAALEREVGAVLVERGARGARLTQAGAILDRHAVIVLGQLAAARAELDDLARLRGGVVRLAAFESSWTALVPAAVSRFRERFPEVELHLAEEDPVAAVAGVRAGTCDVAVVFEPNGVDALDGLSRTVVARDPLWAVLPLGHRLAGGDGPIALAAMAAEPWVAPTAFCAGVVRGACAAAGFAPDVVFSSADYGAVQGFVAAGAGVALVPYLALTGQDRVVARPIAGDAPPARTLAAVTVPAGPRPAAAAALVDVLAEAAAELLARGAAAQSYA